MSLTTYLPSTYSSEKERFKESNGNLKIDYRKSDGSAPFLLGTPYIIAPEHMIENPLEILPSKIPSELHVTGDNGNYRRFNTDIALVSEDFQRNVIILFLSGIVLSSEYVKTIFEKGTVDSEGVLLHNLYHEFTVKDTSMGLPLLNPNLPYAPLKYLEPLILEEHLATTSLIGSTSTVLVKKGVIENIGISQYTEYVTQDIETGLDITLGKVIITQLTEVDYGETGADVSGSISSQIKSISTFEARLEGSDSFDTNLLYVTDFKKEGDTFTSNYAPVLNDTYTNYYLYSKSVDSDQGVVGVSVNVNDSVGVLLNAVLTTNLQEYSGVANLIGKANLLSKTVYTGLLESPFLLVKVDFSEQVDTFSIKINEEVEILLGDYDATSFNYLCSKLFDILYPYNILVIPCEDNTIALNKFNNDADVEILFLSKFTKLTTQSYFSSFKYLNINKTISFDSLLHPANSSFTYMDEDSSVENIRYKVKIGKDTASRDDIYLSERLRLLIDPSTIRGTTKPFKLEVEEGVLDTTFTIEAEMTLDSIIDLIGDSIDTFLSTDYVIEKNYLSSSIDIIYQGESNAYLKVTVENWLTLGSSFDTLYLENPNGSKTIILGKVSSGIGGG